MSDTQGGNTTVTRFSPTLGGGLGASTSRVNGGTATVSLALSNPHGDINATVTLPATGNPTGTDSWTEFSEFGAPREAGNSGTTKLRYGWLGEQQRSADSSSGLIFMGSRLYNATTARFTSVDGLLGGNENTYNYPNDPINFSDVTGQSQTWAACGLHDSSKKKVAQYARVGGGGFARGQAYLKCGNVRKKDGKWVGWGYRKLLAKHKGDWEKMVFMVQGSDWRGMADWGITVTLNAPERVLWNPSNSTYEYRRWVELRDNRSGRPVGKAYLIVVVAKASKNIITTYPVF